MRIYGRDFGGRLAKARLAVTVDDYVDELGEAGARRYGQRRGKPQVHLCVKGEAPAGR